LLRYCLEIHWFAEKGPRSRDRPARWFPRTADPSP
jgi:hypothetical protein